MNAHLGENGTIYMIFTVLHFKLKPRFISVHIEHSFFCYYCYYCMKWNVKKKKSLSTWKKSCLQEKKIFLNCIDLVTHYNSRKKKIETVADSLSNPTLNAWGKRSAKNWNLFRWKDLWGAYWRISHTIYYVYLIFFRRCHHHNKSI